MTSGPDLPWWEDEALRLSPEICQLLRDVDEAFELTGSGLSPWPCPRPFGDSPREDEYSRCSAPMKFLVLAARAQAWKQVLLDRGWAVAAPPVRWARQGQPNDGGIVLSPVAEGAVPLVLAIHDPVTPDDPVSVTIGAGDSAVALLDLPGCGCDACDSGSASLLEDMDTWILSVVDGSLQVELTADRYSVRTSFGSGASAPVHDLLEPTAFTAAPWPADWTTRPLVSATELHHGWGRAAMIGESLAFNLRMTFRRPGTSQRSQVYRAKPWWQF